MSWQTLATIQTTTDWLLTESVTGSLFRITHNVTGTNIQSLRSVIAQAFDEGANNTYFDFRRLSFKPETEAFLFIQPSGLLNRKLAIKRLDNLADSWTITIEVLDGMPESISLPIAITEVEGLSETLATKAAAESLNIHVVNTSNPHNVTANQIGAEVAGAGAAAATSAIANHKAEEDPHAQYATDNQIIQLQSVIDTKVANNDIRLSNPRTPTGAAGGVLAGSYPNPIFKASVFAASLEINGWRKLPSGDIEQWGTARLTSLNGVDYDGSVLFPLSFPNVVFIISPTAFTSDSDIRLFGQIIPVLTKSGCGFSIRNNVTTIGSYVDVSYRVIGA